MYIAGIDTRETDKGSERVLVVQPTEYESQSDGFLTSHTEEGKVEGQELWVHGLSDYELGEIEADPEFAVERGIVNESWPGTIAVAAHLQSRLGTQRGEILQRASTILSTNVIREFGPDIETAGQEALKNRELHVFPLEPKRKWLFFRQR